ncbi:MAG: DUF1059 domain-containing protein [Candidatus Nitrosotenuis sp.]
MTKKFTCGDVVNDCSWSYSKR